MSNDRLARAAALCLLASLLTVNCPAQSRASEWRYYGGDQAGTRYSPLNQINRNNVRLLKRAWVYHTGELDLGLRTASFQASFSATPLVVGGVMYLSTPSSRVIALDAETGRELWKYDPQQGRPVRGFNSHRGVAYWEGRAPGGRGRDRRILYGTVDGRLIALDAATGKPCPDFGDGGAVDLRVGMNAPSWDDPTWGARVTSPPVVFKDLVIVGWGLPESPAKGPSGDVRAYNVRTGRLALTFHTVPRPGEVGHETWEGDSWKERSGANVWSMMSVDEGRGLVFLPVGSPTYDFYGGDRKGQNLFGNSLVALDAATGKLVWYFQTVHHDLWDYDLPAQPLLFTGRGRGRPVPAVAVITKTGFVFVLDRRTGRPLFPVEERAVPQSDVPGEETWPTQPFPVKPPPLARLSIKPDEIFTGEPEHEKFCRDLVAKVGGIHNEGPYTPYSSKEIRIIFPGQQGGPNYGGVAI